MSSKAGQNKTERLAKVEQALGYTFRNASLLKRALTHTSASCENRLGENYQRLEFQGDRVLALVIADMLLANFPNADEGELSRRLNTLVRRQACFEAASALDLGTALYLGPSEARTGGRSKKAILADVCEAVIAAIYQDGGFEAARRFIQKNWTAKMQQHTAARDAKTQLQEWAQSQGMDIPHYETVKRAGPDHLPVFTIKVSLCGREAAYGEGPSKRAGEQAAATAMLCREGVIKAGKTDG